jgi:hypothetical protein
MIAQKIHSYSRNSKKIHTNFYPLSSSLSQYSSIYFMLSRAAEKDIRTRHTYGGSWKKKRKPLQQFEEEEEEADSIEQRLI